MSKLKLQATDGSAGTVSLKAPASTTGNAEFELTLPGSAGSNGQLLSTNGSGVLSWSDDNSGVSLSGSTNNTIATVSGANALVGEANLTFDGSDLSLRATKSNLIVAKTGLGAKASSDIASNYDLIQIGAGGAIASYNVETVTSDTEFIHNAYRHSGNNWKYKYADAAVRIKMNAPQGVMLFENAAAGSADGDITFSERLRIEADGDIGLGTNAPNKSGYGSPVVSIGYNTSNNYSVLELLGNKTSDASISSILGYNVGGSSRVAAINFARDGANNSGAIAFETYASGSSAERMRIDSSGKVGITTASPTTNLNVQGGFHISGTASQTKTQDGLLFQRNTSSGNCEIIAGRAGGNYTGLEHYIAGASGVTLRQSSDYQGNTKWMSGNGSTELFRIRHDGGVTFNGDTAAANALDDYEEGTFTPVVRAYFNSAWRDSGFNQSPNEASGWYTKVGNLVNIFGRIRNFQLDNNSQGSYAGFGGLPFTAKTGTGLYPVIKTFYNSIMADGHAGFYIGASSTLAYTARSDSAQGHTTWGSGTGEFWYYGFYYV